MKKGQQRLTDLIFFYHKTFLHPLDICLLSNNINDYYFVSQGKTSIPGVDDGEELLVTDVSADHLTFSSLKTGDEKKKLN